MGVEALALIVDRSGHIREVFGAPTTVAPAARVGAAFVDLFAPSARRDADRFLAELSAHGGAANWLLMLGDGTAPLQLSFFGTCLPEGRIVVGVSAPPGLVRLYADLVRTADAHADAVQALLRDLLPRRRRRLQPSEALDEVSRISSELATMQRVLAQQRAALERENQVLGVAAHDLRTPLGVISMNTEVLLSGGPGVLTMAQRHLLERIESSCQFMAALISDLLDLSAVQTDRLRLDVTAFDLCDVIRDGIEDTLEPATRKQVRIEVACIGPLEIEADRRRLRQVVDNLLGNAIKFSPAGGPVMVRATIDGDWARVAVTDRGPGIAPDLLPALFQPFQHGGREATAREPSTGLGLVIVRRIAEAHGGRVMVDTQPGRGAEFCVEVPVRPRLR